VFDSVAMTSSAMIPPPICPGTPCRQSVVAMAGPGPEAVLDDDDDVEDAHRAAVPVTLQAPAWSWPLPGPLGSCSLGLVSATAPAASREVRKGTSAQILVSNGPKMIALPAIVGQSVSTGLASTLRRSSVLHLLVVLEIEQV
jgi:hypothetical protein